MGSESLMAAPLWAERYLNLRVFMHSAIISVKRKSCVIRFSVSISPAARYIKCIFVLTAAVHILELLPGNFQVSKQHAGYDAVHHAGQSPQKKNERGYQEHRLDPLNE